MSDSRQIATSKIVSDGNGGLKVKESYLEGLRKWSSPILLGLLVWIGKAAVAELVSLHDAAIVQKFGQEKLSSDILSLAVKTSDNTARIAKLDTKLTELGHAVAP